MTNARYCLLLGNFSILRSPLYTFYEDLSMLQTVVECVSPMKSAVISVSDPGAGIVRIHNTNLDRKVTYVGSEKEIKRFMSGLEKVTVGVEIITQDVEQEMGDCIPSTSSTPSKAPPSNIDDSGLSDSFIEPTQVFKSHRRSLLK